MSTGDAKYFQTTKKGEIRELKDDLNATDKAKIKEAVKKVIAAMTVGKDVSMLFADVIKNMNTTDIELKKLIYLYIINYARSQPEKAILVVSSFLKDSTVNTNPLVRALAIRTMGCIRVERITEYLCDPLNIALKDKDPYVRKTAAICVAKMYDIQSELVEERGFIEILRTMLSDPNPMVVANAVAALTEISQNSGADHFKIDASTLSKLLTALNDCTEWGRVYILEALSRFVPSTSQAKDICDRVIPQVQHSNSAVVMSAVKVVIQMLGILKREQSIKYVKKLAQPLVTLVSSNHPEIQYVALRNIAVIVQKYPKILSNEIRVFFVKYNDAQYVKIEKLEILIRLATKRNAEQVLFEFKEYAQEIDVEFVRKAVRSIGRVAIKLEDAAEKCIKVLSDLVKTKVSYVVQEAVIVIKDIFRRYPKRYEKIIVTLCENLDSLDEPEAKGSMIWIIGEYAQRIKDADERLDYFVDSFEEEKPSVQLQLLTATVKLFLKKPDQAKDLVQRVLNLATEKSDNPDLRDRGYMYWRLLSSNPAAAKAVVLAERPVIGTETFQMPQEYLEALLKNVSTLASVYHRRPEEFVRSHREIAFQAHEEEDPGSSGSDDSLSSDDSEARRKRRRRKKKGGSSKKRKGSRKKRRRKSDDDSSDSDSDGAPAAKKKSAAAAAAPVKKEATPPAQDDLLGDLFGGGGGGGGGGAPAQTGGGGGGLDLMDDFGFGGQSAVAAPVGPTIPDLPFQNVLSNNGFSLDVAFVQKSGKPICVVVAKNQGPNVVNRVDVKFNSNYLGIVPQPQMPLTGNLGAGQTQVIDWPISIGAAPVQKRPLSMQVEVAVRVMYVGGSNSVAKFLMEIPPFVFYTDPGVTSQEFIGKWKQFEGKNSQTVAHTNLKMNADQVDQLLQNSCYLKFIAKRQIGAKGVSLYYTGAIKGVPIFFEISVASDSGRCRVLVKSANVYLAFVGAHSLTHLFA